MCVYLPVPSVPIYLLAGRAKPFFDGTHIHAELLQNQRLTHNSRKVEEKTFRFIGLLFYLHEDGVCSRRHC